MNGDDESDETVALYVEKSCQSDVGSIVIEYEPPPMIVHTPRFAAR